MGDSVEERNPFVRFINKAYMNILDAPVTFFREKIVTPNQKQYPYYHEVYRRVPTIDECYTDDQVCRYEAQNQFLRDRLVDSEILCILRQRFEHCQLDDFNDRGEGKCKALLEAYEDASGKWFCKYGDLGPAPQVTYAFMKQKHRMVWERRHGPVGSGMKNQDEFKVE